MRSSFDENPGRRRQDDVGGRCRLAELDYAAPGSPASKAKIEPLRPQCSRSRNCVRQCDLPLRAFGGRQSPARETQKATMPVDVRDATPDDAEGIVAILNPIIESFWPESGPQSFVLGTWSVPGPVVLGAGAALGPWTKGLRTDRAPSTKDYGPA